MTRSRDPHLIGITPFLNPHSLPAPMTRIISLQSFRPGVGKSNLAANLGALMAAQGKRVGIVDTDRAMPGVHSLFGYDEWRLDATFNDFLGKGALWDPQQPQEPELLKVGEGEVALLSGGVYLLPSGLKLKEIKPLLQQGHDAARLGTGFFQLSLQLGLDFLLLDTPAGLDEESLLAMTLADILIVIVGLDWEDLQKTAVALELAHKLEVPHLLLILNQIPSGVDRTHLRQEIETNYGMPPTAILPLCEEMLLLAGHDVFCLRYPDHPLTQTLASLASQILQTPSTSASRPLVVDDLVQELETGGMSQMLSLPEVERHLLNWMIRQQQPVTPKEIMVQTGKSLEAVEACLDSLRQRNLVQIVELGGESAYRPRLFRRRSRGTQASVWQRINET
ncbi:MAG: MinD/ParA family protein [Cyanobacteriota bacterium]|nr:MinD/ParA family protein [Cyanobacteriota bacterium]